MNYKLINCWLLFIVMLFTISYAYQVYKDFYRPVTYPLNDTVLISRSPEWKYGQGFYAAVITLKKEGDIFTVKCQIHIGDGNYFESVALGNVSSKEEAYSRWGKVMWTDHSLIIGSDEESQITVKRSQIEKHR